MPGLRPVALAAFPRPGTPRRPWTPWRRPGALDTEAPLGVLGHQGVLGRLGHLGHQGVLRGASRFLGEHRGPWTPSEASGSTGSAEGTGAYNCKNGFWSVLENHRFLKKSRKSYQIFRNNSTSQTMKSAQELFYRFWDRAIMTQSIIAVFTNRGGASAQYRTKKVSHN